MAEQKTDSPSSFRITYFPFHGRAGPLRAAAAIGGLAYEDAFVSMDEQKQAKADGKRRWTGLPEMTIFNKEGNEVVTVGQSNACLRYIGGLGGLYPTKDRVQRGLVDEVLDSVEDMISLIAPTMHMQDSAKKKEMRLALMKEDKLPYWLNKFEARLRENESKGNKNGYFVGSDLSVADLKFYFVGDWLMSGILDDIDGNKLMEPNKRCAALVAKIKGNDALKKMLADFAVSQKENKENKTTRFRREGKRVYM